MSILLTNSIFLYSQSQGNALSCNNWLKTISQSDGIQIGDLDINGNKITIEAVFNRLSPYVGSYIYAGDIVSKHNNPSDCNYLLRPDDAEITTTNGFFQTPSICDIELNKTYHVAMTYDGSYLKFYRDGFLMSQVRATGNLIQNNWITTIGSIASGSASTPESMNGFINEVRIWNTVRTQDEIRTYMNISLPSPTTQFGLLAYYTFDDLINKQGNLAWNGTLIGSALINQTNTSCGFIVDSCKMPSCANKNDFSFNFNSCSPQDVSFQTNATGYDSVRWSFGDGNTITDIITPSNTYSKFGNYTVTMITDYPTCADTAVKTITVSVIDDNQLINTNDTTICSGSTKQLHSSVGLNFCWTPTDYLDNPNSANPITSTPKTITYYLQSLITGNNLITNGDFNAGNAGFTSDYLYSPSSGWDEGVYNVGANIHAWHSGMAACGDHTTGDGNMLMVNGATITNVKVWSQTITVIPNTNYAFSAWLQNISYLNPAALQFSINGNNIGNIFNANSSSCVWEKFYAMWNSGSSTSATISIVNQNNIANGNDFALDDISFAPVSILRDSVKIIVDTPSVKAYGNATICEKDTVHLNATGASVYNWTPISGISSSAISNPIVSPSTTTRYIVTGTDVTGCTAKDSIIINVNPLPVISLTNNATICSNSSVQLNASGGTSYSWSPSASLNSSNVSNPIASPAATTVYYVTATNDFSCNNIDSVTVKVHNPSTFAINQPIEVCRNSPAQLNASGGDLYQWLPADLLNNASIANPIAITSLTAPFYVILTDTICKITDTLSTVVNIFPDPLITAVKSNDIDCSVPASNLSATGGIQYTWEPPATLSNPSIANPVASPLVTTKYFVTGTDINDCTSKDSVTVYVNSTNEGGYLMPTAFTPNDDGLNDCYGIKDWGYIKELEFCIYNRLGERVFYTTSPNACWDGTYKGLKQEPGTYIYMIKAKTICRDYVFRKGVFVLIR